MKAFTTSLLILSISAGVLGANVKGRSTAVSGQEKCPTAKVVASSTITVNGHQIVRQTFECPEPGSLTNSITPSGTSFAPRSPFEKRNAGECRTAAPECQCGTNFSCNCQDVTASAPSVSDCTIVIDSTQVLSQTEGPTFLVQPDNFELITFQSCGIEFTNLGSGTQEYCWDELASTANLVNQVCFEGDQGTAAACEADSDLWLTQVLNI